MKTISYLFILLFSMVALSAIPSEGQRNKLEIELDVSEIDIRNQPQDVDNHIKVLKSFPVSVEHISPKMIQTDCLVEKSTENLAKIKEIQSLLEEKIDERKHTARTSR